VLQQTQGVRMLRAELKIGRQQSVEERERERERMLKGNSKVIKELLLFMCRLPV